MYHIRHTQLKNLNPHLPTTVIIHTATPWPTTRRLFGSNRIFRTSPTRGSRTVGIRMDGPMVSRRNNKHDTAYGRSGDPGSFRFHSVHFLRSLFVLTDRLQRTAERGRRIKK